jgi:hypothetical protein
VDELRRTVSELTTEVDVKATTVARLMMTVHKLQAQKALAKAEGGIPTRGAYVVFNSHSAVETPDVRALLNTPEQPLPTRSDEAPVLSPSPPKLAPTKRFRRRTVQDSVLDLSHVPRDLQHLPEGEIPRMPVVPPIRRPINTPQSQ